MCKATMQGHRCPAILQNLWKPEFKISINDVTDPVPDYASEYQGGNTEEGVNSYERLCQS